jgi:hypothetical protein
LDFYFNNITEVGSAKIAKSIEAINNPNFKKLALNLDFNYIGNDGGKMVGKSISKLEYL